MGEWSGVLNNQVKWFKQGGVVVANGINMGPLILFYHSTIKSFSGKVGVYVVIESFNFGGGKNLMNPPPSPPSV